MPDTPERSSNRLIPWPEVRVMTGLSRTTIWRLQQSGAFPSPVQLSPGRVGWLESEVDAWREARLEPQSRDETRFTVREGGRAPVWAAGGRPSGRKAGAANSREGRSPEAVKAPEPAQPMTEQPPPEPAPASAVPRRRRAAAGASGQMDFGF